MGESILVGIGGTGAKCVEAAVHLCAAGLGPPRLRIILIDADRSNGNSRRAVSAVAGYEQARKALRSGGAKLSPSCRLFRTDIQARQDGMIWSILTMESTFRQLFAYSSASDDEKRFMDALFLPNKFEQQLDLQFGFQGMPALGASVIASQDGADNWFRSELAGAFSRGGDNQDIRLFIFGSVFGGTGAAGFPVVARMARRIQHDAQLRGVSIGGALMLPYFSFDEPRETQQGQSRVTAQTFAQKTRLALQHYNTLLEDRSVNDKRPFDQLSVIGWPDAIPVWAGKPGVPGGERQLNPPLLPELYAAAAALGFLTSATPASGVFRTAISDGTDLGWDDVPSISGTNPKDLRDGLGQLLRFGISFNRNFLPVFHEAAKPALRQQCWYHTLVAKQGVMPDQEPARPGINRLSAFLETNLRWAATLQHCSVSESVTPKLLSFGSLVTDTLEEDGLVGARADWLPHDKRRFAELVDGVRAPSLAQIFEELNKATLPKDAAGIAAFCETLHSLCGLTSRKPALAAAL